MVLKFGHLIMCVWIALLDSASAVDMGLVEPQFVSANRWALRNTQRPALTDDGSCARVKPTSRDIVRRIYAILPYFDRDHANAQFLHKFRGTLHAMSEGEGRLEREAAHHAAVLAPLVLLQQYRDTWCLLERFHRALRLYQISHSTEKRSSLKLLQKFSAVSHKVQMFVSYLPGPQSRTSATTPSDPDDEELHDKKDIRYLKELIKNLG